MCVFVSFAELFAAFGMPAACDPLAVLATVRDKYGGVGGGVGVGGEAPQTPGGSQRRRRSVWVLIN